VFEILNEHDALFIAVIEYNNWEVDCVKVLIPASV